MTTTRGHSFPLTAQSDGHGSHFEHELDPPPAPALVLAPISRKKQAVVLFSAFTTIALTIGYNQCFGVFQEFYLSADQDVLTPAPASAATPPTALLAFVGTLCYGLTWVGGIVVNPIISRIEHGAWESTATSSSSPSSSSSRLWQLRALHRLTPKTITMSGVCLMSLGFASALKHIHMASSSYPGLARRLGDVPAVLPTPSSSP